MIDLHASSFLRYYSSYISEKKAADKKVGRKKMQLAFSSFLYFFKLLKDKSELERFFYKLESDGLQLKNRCFKFKRRRCTTTITCDLITHFCNLEKKFTSSLVKILRLAAFQDSGHHISLTWPCIEVSRACSCTNAIGLHA